MTTPDTPRVTTLRATVRAPATTPRERWTVHVVTWLPGDGPGTGWACDCDRRACEHLAAVHDLTRTIPSPATDGPRAQAARRRQLADATTPRRHQPTPTAPETHP